MRVLLIGDSCTDVYVYGDVKRLNPEAPVPILKPKREESMQRKLDSFQEWEVMLVVTQSKGFITYESIVNW